MTHHDAEGDDRMGDAEDPTPAGSKREGNKIKVTYDKYHGVLNHLVRRLIEDEKTSAEGVEQEDLVLWYLEQIEGELDNEDDYVRERKLVKMVLKTMTKVRYVSML